MHGKRGLTNGVLRKLVGIPLAVCGLTIIIAKLPSLFWWLILGTGLILLGGRLFIN